MTNGRELREWRRELGVSIEAEVLFYVAIALISIVIFAFQRYFLSRDRAIGRAKIEVQPARRF